MKIDLPFVDKYRVLAWRNDQVSYYNTLVREAKGGDPTQPFEIGDLIVVNEAYTENDEVVLNTGVEAKVLNMVAAECELFPDLKIWLVTLDQGQPDKVYQVLDPSSRALANQKANKLRNSAIKAGDWAAYYRFKEGFLDAKPPYSLTCHKSQGSTFGTVFVDYRDIYKNKTLSEADRCLYTAITRASERVVICY